MVFMRYKNSFLATLVSALGGLSLIAGIAVIVEGEIMGGIVFIALSIALMAYLAPKISFNKWKKKEIVEKGVEEQAALPGIIGTDICRKIYLANPSRFTLNYIKKINPEAGQFLTSAIEDNKKRNKK